MRPENAQEEKKAKKKEKKEKEAQGDLLDEKLWEQATSNQNVSSWADCDTDEDDDFNGGGGLAPLPEDWKGSPNDPGMGANAAESSDESSDEETDHEDDDMVRDDDDDDDDDDDCDHGEMTR